MKLNQLYYLFGIFLVTGLLFLLWGSINSTSYYASTDINQNLIIKNNETVNMHNGSNLTVNGDLDINGTLKCNNGPLILKVTGNLTVSGQIECILVEEISETSNSSIEIIVNNNIKFTRSAKVTTNSHVQIVKTEARIAKSKDEILEIFNSTQEINKETQIGPLTDSLNLGTDQSNTKDISNLFLNVLSESVNAQDQIYNPDVQISGTWKLNSKETPFAENTLLYINVPSSNLTKISEWTVSGPDGLDGRNSDKSTCSEKGEDGKDAYRINIKGGRFIIENTEINLAKGGNGGKAVTDQNCKESFAQGGKGGKSSNFQIIGTEVEIKDALKVSQGENGKGGDAIAESIDNEPSCNDNSKNNATAIAGSTQNFKGNLFMSDTLSGNSYLTIQSAEKSQAGEAYAKAGKGSNGNACGCDGGQGGDAEAAGSTITILPGKGGNAGQCTKEEASLDPNNAGKGGQGGHAFLNQSNNIIAADGGLGGEGSDGCPAGLGGIGGTGLSDGTHGKDGINTCPSTDTLELSPLKLVKKHSNKINNCPNIYSNNIKIENSKNWKITESPKWLDFKQINEQEVQAIFNCNIKDIGIYHSEVIIESEDKITNEQTRTVQVIIEVVN